MTAESKFIPRNKNFRARVEQSFNRQRVMQTLGVSLTRVAAGEVELHLAHRADLVQQHGFLHAGVIATALDSACGYAALSLMPDGAEVLTVEFKIDLLAPAKGDEFAVIGAVVKAGRTISVARGEAFARHHGERKLIAQMNATLMTMTGRLGMVD